MADPSAKAGPLTLDELRAIWRSAADRGYTRPLEQAGDGEGFEAWGQLFAQVRRVSEAVDRTFESLFVLPWSGQTNPPAAGGARATVTLTLARSSMLAANPIRLQAGTLVDELAIDSSDEGPIEVLTGRRYALDVDVFFFPGDAGPRDVQATAERFGFGYNDPWPGTLKAVDQPGAGYSNTGGSVAVVSRLIPPPPPSSATLTARNVPDMFVPAHVGQYVAFTAGSNAGKQARVVAYHDPQPLVLPDGLGSGVDLELLLVVEVVTGAIAGTFAPGEPLKLFTGITPNGTARLVATRALASGRTQVAFVLTSGSPGAVILGAYSGASVPVDHLLYDGRLAPESNTASWRVQEWDVDLGVSVTNVAQPSGGRAAMLDALGKEKNLPRAAGEGDDPYRVRVAEPADVVSPNAIRRALNRVLSPLPWCFREVGLALLPGFYFDEDAFDYDVVQFDNLIGGPAFIDPVKFQERVEVRDSAGHVKARGWFGRRDSATRITIVYATGLGSLKRDDSVAAGDVVFGFSSGATFAPVTSTPSASLAARRFRLVLDYADFRAFFLVGVPPSSLGEFGFAYDMGPLAQGFYDMTGASGYYDGYPYLAARVRKRVHDTILPIKAAGVGYKLYVEDGDCA